MIENDLAAASAQRYFHSTKPLHCLGWGITGFVYLSPDANTAVKVHRRPESFLTELKAYRKLRDLRINKICGLEIPVLRGSSEALLLIRMDVVSAPYLLDFAGVTFRPPDFPEDTIQLWRQGIEEAFAPNEQIAFEVYDFLAEHEIYYMDFRPSNMNLNGLPGLKIADPVEDDDFS